MVTLVSAVSTTDCDSVSIGSNPIRYPNAPVDELVESLLSKGRRKNLVVSSNLTRGTIMVDSTGVRLGFINLGERSDGLQRLGS